MQPSSFIILTGLSGSGKGTFLRALEDRGFFCVDNLPLGLLSKFYELIVKSEGASSKAAVVIDVREGETLRTTSLIHRNSRFMSSGSTPSVCSKRRKRSICWCRW